MGCVRHRTMWVSMGLSVDRIGTTGPSCQAAKRLEANCGMNMNVGQGNSRWATLGPRTAGLRVGWNQELYKVGFTSLVTCVGESQWMVHRCYMVPDH